MDTGIENARRVVHWIDMMRDDQTFTREVIFNELNTNDVHVSFYAIDSVLDRQVLSGKVEVIASTPHRTILRKVKKMDYSAERKLAFIESQLQDLYGKVDQMPDKPKNDTEKRLSDLEIKYKWLESVVAEMHMKDNQVLGTQKPLTPKKERLWRPMAHTTDHNSPAFFAVSGRLIDVMLADGEVVTKMERTRIPVKDYPHDPKNVVAWREAE